jgi:tripartite-type tricarboxylate transporter receptor subunit TctC
MTTELNRRRFLLKAVPAAAALALPLPLLAQSLPETARILSGYPAGGSIDIVARKLADRLTGRLARSVIVETKTGAAGRLAVEGLKTSAADGLTLVVTPGSVVTMYPHIYKNLSYDVFADLAPVSIVAVTAFALAVGPAVPPSVTSFADFVAWCKANPAAAQIGNPGAGSFPHFMAMLLARDVKLDLVHVPYRGGSAAMQAAAGGQVSAVLATEASAIPLAQAGKLRVLATSTTDRSNFFPQAPTFRELGFPGLAQREWFAAFMPAKTPAAAVAVASEGLRAALREPEVQELWRKTGLSAEGSTPAELQRALRSEHDFWGPIIRASGFTPEA